MEKLKKYIKKYSIIISFILIYALLFTLLNHFYIIKTTTFTKLNFIVIALLSFVFAILNGKSLEKNGYIEGLKLGLITILILFILNIIFIRKFSLIVFIYYLVILISNTIGSVIGINLKRK